ncbi:MAG: Eco57I restriction-modification methylase domain-containing protein [Bacteroidales bacterium]|nr:Eco57I restriction-modification methylase domain-containing protein [Bacteroidales bacterium]
MIKEYSNQDIHKLIERYESNRTYYLTERYNETLLRSDFLDPLFELLGWDIKNKAGKTTNEREVILEEPLKNGASENTKKPDYTFRLFAERKFFLEAKKPCVHIHEVDAPARQVRRYGYTANLKISVLSNFEYLMIYDASVKVEEKDTNNIALIKKYHYTEYEENFEELKRLLGKESVYSGQFDEEWKDIEVRLKQWSVDRQFLSQINEWRLLLGKEILAAEPTIDIELLGDEVQSYINKILFLRVCEDRNIETYKELLTIADAGQFNNLLDKFRKADIRYNSGLFEQTLSDQVICNASSAFWTIIRHLYFPESPYSFSVFSSDILGRIYEIFIAEKLAIVNGELQIVKKPENEDRDVVTTPTYIIREILRKTISPLCKDKSAHEIMKIKIADIACGSGAFLLEAYQLLNDILIDYYISYDTSKLVQIGENAYRLKFTEKKRLLTNCIYGVDKDFNAAEACKFGLLLKLLENEDSVSLMNEHPILPDLKNNIFFGNSLLSNEDITNEDAKSINPFDFGNIRFDAIIGNPPYLTTEGIKKFTPKELPLYKKKYVSAYKQFDKYIVFVERAMNLLKEKGFLGYIIPLKFMKVGAGQELRRIITTQKNLDAITVFGACQVFPDKSNYTCLLILKKTKHLTFSYNEVSNLEKWKLADKNLLPTDTKYYNEISEGTWALFPEYLRDAYNTILSNSTSLSNITGEDNIFNGIQTSANKVYIFQPKSEKDGVYTFIKDNKEWQIEKEVTRPYFQTSSGNDALNTYRTFKPNACVIFPYRKNIHGKLEIIPLSDIKKDYPKLYMYLTAHKYILNAKSRDIKPEPTTPDEWHKYGRHQSLDACNLPEKIIVGVLSTGDKYAVDSYSTFVSSGGTAGYCMVSLPEDSPYSIYYLQAILNSKYIEWISSLYGEIFRGGFIARGTKVLKQLPIRKIDFENNEEINFHNRIAELQKQLIKTGDEIYAKHGDRRKLIVLQRQFDLFKQQLEDNIMLLYNMEKYDNIIPIIKEQYAAD